MTREEAIESLNLDGIELGGNLRRVTEFLEALVMAEKALEKQIPKKPRFVDVRFRSKGRYVSDGVSLDKCYECPNCKSHIFHIWDSAIYCPYCGQALDWSE